MTDTTDGLDWRITEVVTVSDGDTVRVRRHRVVRADDHLLIDVHDDPDRAPRGIAIRLTWTDTPERGEDGWAQARQDTTDWLAAHTDLRVTTYGPGGFGRTLGDIWAPRPDGGRDSLSQWLLGERGWPPYVKGQ